MKSLRIVSLVLLLVVSLFAAAPALYVPFIGLTDVETLWNAVPTSSELVCTETIWLTHIAFSTGATARTITATDAQGTPVAWLTAIPLTANQMTIIALPQRGSRMQGGFYLTASGAGVTYQFAGRVKR